LNSQIRSINKCAVCDLQAAGVTDAEKYVLPQYRMTWDINRGPVPIDAEGPEVMFDIFPEERPPEGEAPPRVGGIMGTVKSVFRALGFSKEPQVVINGKVIPTEVPKSRQAAIRKRKSTLYD
jgi:hypothetical protein